MPFSEELNEALAVVGYAVPLLRDNTTVATGWIAVALFRRLLFICSIGAVDISVDFKLRQATDGSGTGAADITGKLITQFSATDDNKIALIELTAEEVGAGFTHVEGLATIGDGVTGANICLHALGGVPRYHPASDYDLAAVAQIVS